jgi:hypothetical protein
LFIRAGFGVGGTIRFPIIATKGRPIIRITIIQVAACILPITYIHIAIIGILTHTIAVTGGINQIVLIK